MIEIKEEFLTCDKLKRAIKMAGYEALAMWLALKGYAAKHPNDGFIPDEDIDALDGAPRNPHKALKALLECGRRERDGSRGAGLVDQAELGWQLHDYLDHAASKEEETERRRKARERKQRWRQERYLSRDVPQDMLRHSTRHPAGRQGDMERDCPVGRDAGLRAQAGARATHARGRPRPQPNPTQPDPSRKEDPKDLSGSARATPPDSSSSSPDRRSSILRFEASLVGKLSHQREDVHRVFERFKALAGLQHASLGGYADARA
ncbi:MAG TPA: hypothetical protein VGJ84_06325, partial [Polyangiaceae bacterium]